MIKAKGFSIGVLIIAVLASAATAMAQGNAFTDANVPYSFSLPDEKWRMTLKPSATSPNVEYVYNDRSEAVVDVRKITVAKDAIMGDVVQTEAQKLQFSRPGYVAGREENFVGRYRGSVFNYEFVAQGRSRSGRHYFLRVNDTTVYVLRFSGDKDALRQIRNQTDSIARTFAVKD